MVDRMGDLIGFQGFLNESAPINPNEYDYVWKYDRRYWDFQPGNEVESECPWEYPRFWDDDAIGLATKWSSIVSLDPITQPPLPVMQVWESIVVGVYRA